MHGFIKDHRKELGSDIWSMPPLYHRTWQWMKYNVNHEDQEIPMRDGSHMTIKRGQRLTSVRDIAKGIGWWEGTKWKEPNPKTMSTILDWMIKTGMIIIDRGQGNRQYTLVTLVKYEEYQEKNIQGNSKVTAEKQSVDINKNDKELKELKDINKDLKICSEIVSMKETEYNTLVKLMTEPIVILYIERFEEWIVRQTPREQKKRSAYLSIRNWYKRDKENSTTIGKTKRPEPNYTMPTFTQEELDSMPRG